MCHMIKRAIYLALCAIMLIGLALIADTWDALVGQAVYKLTAEDDDALRGEIADAAEKCGVAAGAFAIRDLPDGTRLYECAAYHPEAFGITLVSGAPITSAHIAARANVVMLSAEAATAISPEMDCIGGKTEIDGCEYTIIGIYDDCAPAAALTRTAAVSAIVPAACTGETRAWYVWIKAETGNAFAFQQAGNMLGSAHRGVDAGGWQAENISENALAGIQRCRLMALATAVILSAGVIRHTRRWRGIFAETAKAAFRDNYLFRAVLASVRPFIRYMLPIIAVCLAAAAFAVYCAANIHIGVDAIPASLLDIGQWIDIWENRIIAINTNGRMPVYAANLDRWLSGCAWVAGLAAMVGAMAGVSGGRKGGCDG